MLASVYMLFSDGSMNPEHKSAGPREAEDSPRGPRRNESMPEPPEATKRGQRQRIRRKGVYVTKIDQRVHH